MLSLASCWPQPGCRATLSCNVHIRMLSKRPWLSIFDGALTFRALPLQLNRLALRRSMPHSCKHAHWTYKAGWFWFWSCLCWKVASVTCLINWTSRTISFFFVCVKQSMIKGKLQEKPQPIFHTELLRLYPVSNLLWCYHIFKKKTHRSTCSTVILKWQRQDIQRCTAAKMPVELIKQDGSDFHNDFAEWLGHSSICCWICAG